MELRRVTVIQYSPRDSPGSAGNPGTCCPVLGTSTLSPLQQSFVRFGFYNVTERFYTFFLIFFKINIKKTFFLFWEISYTLLLFLNLINIRHVWDGERVKTIKLRLSVMVVPTCDFCDLRPILGRYPITVWNNNLHYVRINLFYGLYM